MIDVGATTMCATRWQRGLALIVLVNMAWTTACTSLQVVPLGDAHPQTFPVPVAPSARVTTKGDEEQDSKVSTVTADALLAARPRVRYDDIAAVELRQRDQDKTNGLVLAAVIGGLLLTAAALSQMGGLAPLEY